MKLYSFLATLLISFQGVAQTLVQSPEQQLVESAVKSGLFIVKQNYCLKKVENGTLYGRGGKNEFGTTYSVGVKLPGAWYLTDMAVHPWKYDSHYEPYKGNEKYLPVNEPSLYWLGADTTDYRSIELNPDSVKTLLPETLYQYVDKELPEDGFAKGNAKGEKSGWVIWLTVDKDADLSTRPEIIYNISRQKITVEKGKNASIAVPLIKAKILGGIFVIPEDTGVGKLIFKLAGVMTKDKDSWAVVFPFNHEGAAQVEEAGAHDEPVKDELTPISSKERKDTDKKAKGKKKK